MVKRINLVILFSIITSFQVFGYEEPQMKHLSFYAGFALSGLPHAFGMGPPFIFSKIALNVPLGRMLKNRNLISHPGLYIGIKNFKVIYPFILIQEYILHTKLFSKKFYKFNVVPAIGTKLVVDKMKKRVSIPLSFGGIISYSPLKYLSIFAPTFLNLYSDGFEYNISLGINPYIRPIHTGFVINTGYTIYSKYNISKTGSNTSLEAGIGVRF